MKNKKIVIPALIAAVALVGGAIYIPVSRAATDLPLFGTTSLLGVNLLMGNSGGAQSVVTVVDFSADPEVDQNYTLPSVVGKAGKIIFVKAAYGALGDDGTFLHVYPAEGELLDGGMKEYQDLAVWGLIGGAIFIADPANNTWWVVSNA